MATAITDYLKCVSEHKRLTENASTDDKKWQEKKEKCEKRLGKLKKEMLKVKKVYATRANVWKLEGKVHDIMRMESHSITVYPKEGSKFDEIQEIKQKCMEKNVTFKEKE